MSVKMSKTSKLGTKSWSLQALATCPGSKNKDGSLVPACSGCYATGGMYSFPKVKAVRTDNQADWKRDGWVAEMVQELKNQSHFRWFDSGDLYDIRLAAKVLQIMQSTPDTKHWLPTRMHKFAKFQSILNQMDALPNVKVRPSSDAVDGSFIDGVHGSTILPVDAEVPDGVFECNAPNQGGKCLSCRACYSKSIKVIGYRAHGQKMRKVIRLALAA